MHLDIQKVRERTSILENQVTIIENDSGCMKQELKAVGLQSKYHDNRIDETENRLRRNNVLILGIPECMEGGNTAEFIEKWLLDVFGKQNFTSFFAVKRAHRIPARPPPPGNLPRPIILKMLHFRDRDKILTIARTKGNIEVNGSRVSFFPDFSVSVQKQRAQFMDIKRRLRTFQIQYAMLYPAKLQIVAKGETIFFVDPKEANSWLDRNEQSLSIPTSNKNIA